MLAKVGCFVRAFLPVLLLAGAQPLVAQPQGVQSLPSSFSFVRGTAPGVSTSLSTMGPNGYSNILQSFLGTCCADAFLPRHLPVQPKPPFAPTPHPHHHNDDSGGLPIAVPVYVPYAVGYVPDPGDDPPDEIADPSDASVEPDRDTAPVKRNGTKRHDVSEDVSANAEGDSPLNGGKDSVGDGRNGPEQDSSTEEAAAATPDPPAEPVVVQPTTVLVFKDGHRSQVVNYAILGDTLFDFADGRTHKILLGDLDLPATHKANDALGVEFTLPPENPVPSSQ